ncbi:hypothetical protein DL769_002820 [Monosporascus sp. CRB-8-3]|nr:hypothetical protein DL769_002820 [Monosporascus sp. CRB-8-3]
MPSSDCPLCYNLNHARIGKLFKNTCSIGQAPRHWMEAHELRASARGVGGTSHFNSGTYRAFKGPCNTCSLLKDAVETFLCESCLAAKICPSRKDCDALKYSVAVVNSEDDTNGQSNSDEEEEFPNIEDLSDESDTDSWSTSSFSEDLNEDRNNPVREKSGTSIEANTELHGRGPERLKLVLRCNLDPIGDEHEDAEELELEVFTVVGEIVPPAFALIGSAGEVPTDPSPRVLDLADDRIVLVETGHREDLYVALSHCWGREQILVTTRKTLSDRMKGIALDDMPLTFRDAVKLTRALNLRYLWIDSLCIIQQDAQDWEEQSAVMADIYANCYLNIATTRSSSGAEGFLRPRWTSRNSWDWADRFAREVSPSTGEPICKIRKCDVKSFTLSNPDDPHRYGNSMKVRLALNSSHEAMQTFRWIGQHRNTAPLILRGWVYQERNLSPRSVHFHANEMMWDCANRQRCECSALDTKNVGGDGWSASKGRISTLSTLDEGQLHGLWRTIVEDYCLLDLTYESDRLPALGGLATRFSEHMPVGNEYLAGMWKSSLGRDLLWKINSEPNQNWRKQLKEKSPPSWSWASLVHGEKGPGLRWEKETKPKLAKGAETFTYVQDQRFSIIEASCSLDSTSKFGRVSGGKIVAKGAMCAVSVSSQVSAGRAPLKWASKIPVRAKSAFNSLHLNYDDERDADEITSADSPTSGFVFCLFVGTFFSHFDDNPDNTHPEHRGLILRPSATVLGAAERIGSWSQYIEHWVESKSVFTKHAATVVVTIV